MRAGSSDPEIPNEFIGRGVFRRSTMYSANRLLMRSKRITQPFNLGVLIYIARRIHPVFPDGDIYWGTSHPQVPPKLICIPIRARWVRATCSHGGAYGVPLVWALFYHSGKVEASIRETSGFAVFLVEIKCLEIRAFHIW